MNGRKAVLTVAGNHALVQASSGGAAFGNDDERGLHASALSGFVHRARDLDDALAGCSNVLFAVDVVERIGRNRDRGAQAAQNRNGKNLLAPSYVGHWSFLS